MDNLYNHQQHYEQLFAPVHRCPDIMRLNIVFSANDDKHIDCSVSPHYFMCNLELIPVMNLCWHSHPYICTVCILICRYRKYATHRGIVALIAAA